MYAERGFQEGQSPAGVYTQNGHYINSHQMYKPAESYMPTRHHPIGPIQGLSPLTRRKLWVKTALWSGLTLGGVAMALAASGAFKKKKRR